MNTENLEFEIISEEAEISELFVDYWKFGENKKFAYTLKEILVKHNISKQAILEKEVSKIGFVQVRRKKDCNKCYEKRKFYVRSRFNYYVDRIKGFDNKCIDCTNKKNIKFALDTLEYYKKEYRSPTVNLFENQDLSYLEKIHLYLLIENYIKYSGIVKNWYFLNAIGGYTSQIVLGNLAKKGFILNHENNLNFINKQNKLKVIYESNKNIFDDSLSEDILNFIKINFEYHTDILIPSQFENINDWFVELFNDIQNHKIKLSDIKDVEEFLLNMRLSEIYALAEFVCKTNQIPLLKNNALEFEFLRVVDIYNLEQIYNIFNYQATYTTSELYRISVSAHNYLDFSKDKIFTKNIGKSITFLQQKSSDQLYSKRLPRYFEQSEFEIFISAHIIRKAQKWDKLMPKDILSSWMSVVQLDVED